MLKLLLVAPTCDGEDVGEAWVAYRWARLLGERHEVTLLTYHKRGARPAAAGLPGVRVVEWTEPPLLHRAERLNSMLKPGYLPFHHRARRWIRAALDRGETFDVAHQPTPVAMRYPSPLAGLPIPYLVGPVGGSLDSPPGFAGDESGSPWYVRLRRFDALRLRHDPLLRRTYSEAAVVLGIAPYVRDCLGDVSLQRFEVLSETGIEHLPPPVDRSADRSADPGRPGGEVRLLYVGRLVRTKGLRDAVRALGRVPALPASLDVVGDGYEEATCRALAAELGVAHKVRFHGRLPRAEVDRFYREADVFVFPSYREAGGNVAFEAMAQGLPLVVTDVGGPGSATDDTCALRIHPVTPEGFAADLAGALTRLVEDRALRLRLGAAGRERVARIALWDRKVDRVGELYAEAIAARR